MCRNIPENESGAEGTTKNIKVKIKNGKGA
jgi:hypothetical protein